MGVSTAVTHPVPLPAQFNRALLVQCEHVVHGGAEAAHLSLGTIRSLSVFP
jgi:hypothetical protein